MKDMFFTLFISLTLISCNKEKSNNNEENLILTREPMVVGAKNANELIYKMYLPETLQVNKPYSAIIEFESDFDKIIDPLQAGGTALKDSMKSRVIQFFQYEPLKLSETTEKYITKDSVLVLNKRFTVDNILFKEKGEYLFQGYLLDEIMYNFYNEKGIRDSIHFDQRRQMITKKVVVVD